jgi:hypothetical protein
MIPHLKPDQKQEFLKNKANEFAEQLANDIKIILENRKPRPYYLESDFKISKISNSSIVELKSRLHTDCEYVWKNEIDDKCRIYYGQKILIIGIEANQDDLNNYIEMLKSLAEVNLFAQIKEIPITLRPKI